MATLGDLKERIANELHRTDLTSQIALAIPAAIDFYSIEGHYFSEERVTSSTEADQEWYALPSDYVFLYTLRLDYNSSEIMLKQRNDQYMEQHYTPASRHTDAPRDFAIFDEQLRLGPIPNDAYTLTMHYLKIVSSLGADTDSNAYTTSIAEQMIRARSKWDLYTNVIHDQINGQAQKALELEALHQLNRKSTRQQVTGRITAHL